MLFWQLLSRLKYSMIKSEICLICQIFEFYVTALLPLAHKVAQGFNQPCPSPRTLTMVVDLIKAFDMVNHTKLIRTLSLSSLSNNTKRWLSAYLTGRTASCRYNFTVSRSFHSRAGVPQGACLSPTLFNIFVSGGVSFCSLTNY